jgi:hypothetical protein
LEIFAVKNHDKITDEMDSREISIMIAEYCYLGVTLDMSRLKNIFFFSSVSGKKYRPSGKA